VAVPTPEDTWTLAQRRLGKLDAADARDFARRA
jgi:hypothetical protein